MAFTSISHLFLTTINKQKAKSHKNTQTHTLQNQEAPPVKPRKNKEQNVHIFLPPTNRTTRTNKNTPYFESTPQHIYIYIYKYYSPRNKKTEEAIRQEMLLHVKTAKTGCAQCALCFFFLHQSVSNMRKLYPI